MPTFDPSKKHALYEKWVSKWRRQRDVVEGEDRVKTSPRRTEYLPRLSGQGTEAKEHHNPKANSFSSYETYLARASFLNATGRTVEGLIGAIMRKDPEVVWPEAQAEALDVVGHTLESFSEIIDETLEEVVGIGRYGHLVDMPDEGENAEPFVATYIAETITDWELGEIDGRKQTVRVNLYESSGIVGKAKKKELEQYRVLRLGIPEPATEAEEKMSPEKFLALWGLSPSDFEEGPLYFAEIWREIDEAQTDGSGKKSRFARVELAVPTMAGGIYWREIPWTFFNPTGCKPKPDRPTLLDLAVVNLSHYRNSADLEHGLHFTALPQPWLAGFKYKGEIQIGSGAAWVTEEKDAKAGYLEFSGKGLSAISDRMDEKKKEMIALGARLLEEQSPAAGAEAAETVRLRHSGEGSALAKLANAVSKGLTRTLEFLAAFRGMQNATVSTQLNTDFGVEGLSPEMLNALMAQVIGGMMSWDTYVFNARRGELYPDDFDEEEEAKAIAAGPPGGDATSLMKPEPEGKAPADDDPDDEGEEPEA